MDIRVRDAARRQFRQIILRVDGGPIDTLHLRRGLSKV
jgi:hypothetical protein